MNQPTNPILSTTDADFFIWHVICNHTGLTGNRLANSGSMLRVLSKPLGKAINMLIQNRIAGIGVAEKIDLGWHLSHFRGNLGHYAAT